MTVNNDNSEFLAGVLRDRLADGLTFAAAMGARLYHEGVTENTHLTFPDGPFEPEEIAGPHSKPGEYPARETGQGAENIDFQAASPAPGSSTYMVSRFGVRGERSGFGPFGNNTHRGGMHLYWLTVYRNRKGPLDVMRENREAIRQAFIRGVGRKGE